MFHRARKMSSVKRIVFTLFIGIGVIAFWRGAWNLMDIYLLPMNASASAWVSLITGFIVLLLTHHLTKELT